MKTKILFFLVIAVVPLSALFGAESILWKDVFSAGSTSYRILMELRIPRLIVCIAAGGALACLGASYQTLFLNPLAEPFVLGVSNAVILGAAIAELFFQIPPYSFQGPLVGFVFALLLSVVMLALYRKRMGGDIQKLILFGMGTQFVLSSVLFLALSYYSQTVGGGGSLRWLFGQIPWLGMDRALLFAGASLPFLAFMFLYSRNLDALSLGSSVATTLGVPVHRTRVIWFVVTSAFISLIVSFTGAIGFVGLVIPHLVKIWLKPPSMRWLFFYSYLLGAFLLAFADVLSRLLMPPYEFPIGILTTLFGGPVFLFFLARRR